MKKLFKYAQTDKIIKFSLQISGVLLLAQLLYAVFAYFSLPPLVPIFNQLPWGEERLGQKFEIFIPALLTLIFLFGNLLLVNRVYDRMPLLSRILSITTLLINVLSFIFTVQTLSIILWWWRFQMILSFYRFFLPFWLLLFLLRFLFLSIKNWD